MTMTAEGRIELGARLRALRMGRGLSADAVASQALGFRSPHHAAVTRLERGVLHRVPQDHVLKLARFYGVAVDELLPAGTSVDDLATASAVPNATATETTIATPDAPPELQQPAAPLEATANIGNAPAACPGVEVVAEKAADLAQPETVPAPGRYELPTPSLQARLRQLRAQLGLTPVAFAHRLDTRLTPVSERDVRDWESAARRPSAAQFESLERVTGASVAWMKTGRTATPAHAYG